MSSNKSKEKENNNLEESRQNDDCKNDNKNLLIKFTVLKNALIEEKKKTASLEKENIALKEEINKNSEIILELKDEVKKYHDLIDKKEKTNFFSELLNNINISEIKNEAIINKLNSENFRLKEELSITKNELKLVKEEINDILSNNKKHEKKINELMQEKEIIDKKYKSEKEILDKKFNSEKEVLTKKITEYDVKIRNLEEKVRIFNNDRTYFEENITKLKNEIKTYKELINDKNAKIEKLLGDQENIINNNMEYQQKVQNLKNVITQYKKAIENNTQITDDYVFIGKLMPNTHYNNTINIPNGNNINEEDLFLKVENKINNINNTQNLQKIKIWFDFYRGKIHIKIENQKEIKIETKNIIDIVQNLHIEGQIKIFYKIKDKVFDYLCQFTKKEAEFIIFFYKELKERSSINPALKGLYLATSI